MPGTRAARLLMLHVRSISAESQPYMSVVQLVLCTAASRWLRGSCSCRPHHFYTSVPHTDRQEEQAEVETFYVRGVSDKRRPDAAGLKTRIWR
jgi:hypothetical protein